VFYVQSKDRVVEPIVNMAHDEISVVKFALAVLLQNLGGGSGINKHRVVQICPINRNLVMEMSAEKLTMINDCVARHVYLDFVTYDIYYRNFERLPLRK
jgi:hypothetical protein